MMHRCTSSSHHHQGNMPSSCTCALFHSQNSNSFSSMLFSSSIPSQHKYYNDHDHQSAPDMMYPSSSSVDCTLSLGTPSTRLSDQYHDYNRITASNFCSNGWDNILQSKESNNFSTAQTTTTTTHKSSRSTNANSNNYNDTLLARRCANCDTTSTPLWRNGPRGPKSLCNACGIRYKKEERRATAANGSASSGGAMEQQQVLNYGYTNHQAGQKMQCYTPAAAANEFRFIQDSDVRDSADAIPFLSWRLNVTDRPSLVHDFTR